MCLSTNTLHRKELLLSKMINEKIRYHQKVCEYALKHGVSKAARRDHTNRQFVTSTGAIRRYGKNPVTAFPKAENNPYGAY